MWFQQSKIEKVPRGIRGEKSSKDMASSRNLVSTIGALASPKVGDECFVSVTAGIVYTNAAGINQIEYKLNQPWHTYPITCLKLDLCDKTTYT